MEPKTRELYKYCCMSSSSMLLIHQLSNVQVMEGCLSVASQESKGKYEIAICNPRKGVKCPHCGSLERIKSWHMYVLLLTGGVTCVLIEQCPDSLCMYGRGERLPVIMGSSLLAIPDGARQAVQSARPEHVGSASL